MFQNLICVEIFFRIRTIDSCNQEDGHEVGSRGQECTWASGPVAILALTKRGDLQYLLSFIRSEKGNIMLVHMRVGLHGPSFAEGFRCK